MQALPMITPSIVSIARTLFARNACSAGSTSHPRKADVLRGAAIGGGTTESDAFRGFGVSSVSFTDSQCAIQCETFSKCSSRVLASFRRDRAAAPRDIAPPLRCACPALHRAAPASRARPHARANRFDPACSRYKPSNTALHPRHLCPKAPAPRPAIISKSRIVRAHQRSGLNRRLHVRRLILFWKKEITSK